MSSSQPPPPDGSSEPTRISNEPLGQRAQQYNQPGQPQQPGQPGGQQPPPPPGGQQPPPPPGGQQPPPPPGGQQPPPPPGGQQPPPPPGGQPSPAPYGQQPGQPYPPQGQFGQRPPGSADGAPTGTAFYALIALGVGALITIIAVFLPWAKIEAPEFGLSESVNGVAEGASDGWICLVLALIPLGLAIARIVTGRTVLSMSAGIAGIVAGLIVAIIAIANISDFNDTKNQVESMGGGGVEANLNIGIFLIIIGGIVMIAGGVMAVLKKR